MILNFYWPLDGSGDELKGFGVGKQLLFHRASPLPRRPPLPWAPLAMTFSLSQWVGGGVDGNEQRERPEKGLGGGLDESQGIPAPAACTRGPELPFLRLLCKPKPVSFEMAPGSHRPPVPTPCPFLSLPSLLMQVSREEKGVWEEPRGF